MVDIVKFLFHSSVLLSFVFLGPVYGSEIKYKIQDLGTLQSESSKAVLINEAGQVAGYYTWKEVTIPYFWDPNEGLMVINVPKGFRYKIASFAYSPVYRIIGWLETEGGKAIGLKCWDMRSGLYDRPLKLNNGSALKEILGVASSYNWFGTQVSNYGEDSYFVTDSSSSYGAVLPLPCIHGDLGIPATISSIVGSCFSGHGVVANCLCPIVNKGEIVGNIEKMIYWDGFKGWNVNTPLIDNRYAFSRALAINNNGQIICETEDGWRLVDLKKNSSFEMRNFGSVKSFNSTGYFITENMDMVEVALEDGVYGKWYLNFRDPKVVVNLQNGWKNICSVNAINDAGYVIGEAETEYGEVHAILLVPVN